MVPVTRDISPGQTLLRRNQRVASVSLALIAGPQAETADLAVKHGGFSWIDRHGINNDPWTRAILPSINLAAFNLVARELMGFFQLATEPAR